VPAKSDLAPVFSALKGGELLSGFTESFANAGDKARIAELFRAYLKPIAADR
jgi:hypothetical protein